MSDPLSARAFERIGSSQVGHDRRERRLVHDRSVVVVVVDVVSDHSIDCRLDERAHVDVLNGHGLRALAGEVVDAQPQHLELAL